MLGEQLTQLTLPGFENIPFKNADLMTAKRDYNDYYLNLTIAGLNHLGQRSPFGEYNPLFVPVDTDAQTPESIALVFSRDTARLWRNGYMNPTVIEKDETGMTIWVYPPALKPILDGGHYMTRYDGHQDKLWIRMTENTPV